MPQARGTELQNGFHGLGKGPVRDQSVATGFRKAARLWLLSPTPRHQLLRKEDLPLPTAPSAQALGSSGNPSIPPHSASPRTSPNAAAPQAKTRRAPFRWDPGRGKAPAPPGTRAARLAWLPPCRRERRRGQRRGQNSSQGFHLLCLRASSLSRPQPLPDWRHLLLSGRYQGREGSSWKWPPQKLRRGRFQVPASFLSRLPARIVDSRVRTRVLASTPPALLAEAYLRRTRTTQRTQAGLPRAGSGRP